MKNDIHVPTEKLAEFSAEAEHVCNEIVDGIVINHFRHLGDGNVHYNSSPPKGQSGFVGLEDELSFRLPK